MRVRLDFFEDEDVHPVALGTACQRMLGEGWPEWESRTIYDELRFMGYKVSELNAHKLHAYRTAVGTISPWIDIEVFESVGHAFNNKINNFSLRQPLSLAELLVTVDTLNKCRPIDYSEDIKKYIAACAASAEILYLPPPLEMAMKYLCPPMYTCLDCGSTDVDDLIDGQCDLCVGRYEDGVLIDGPTQGLQERGKNIKRHSPYRYANIANKFSSLSSVDINTIQLDATMDDIQVAKLLDADGYLKRNRARLDLDIQELRHAQ